MGPTSPSEQSSCNVYRIDQNGTLGLITDKLIKPNGLCFNKSETKLYVSDTGGSHVEGVLEIFTVLILIGNKFHLKLQVLCGVFKWSFDGFRIDNEDRIWSSAADGVPVIIQKSYRENKNT